MAATNSKPAPARRFRFSLQGMILHVTLLALAIVGVKRYIDFKHSAPIAAVVDQINAQIIEQYAGSINDSRPLVTVDRFIGVLVSDDKQVANAPKRFTALFQRIVNTRRVPIEAKFDVVPVVSNQTFADGWSIRIKIDGGALSHTLVIEK